MVSQAEYASLMDALAAYRQSDPLLFLKGVALSESLTEPKLRHLRAEALHALAMKLREALRVCDFQNEIVIRPEGVFVQLGGILLDVSHSPQYLKSSGTPAANQAEALAGVLRRMNIDVSTAVDVGANCGEIALWLAREYPAARIVAVEPSSHNMRVLELNKAAQEFSTARLELIREAVGDKAGVAKLTAGTSPMNRLVPGDRSGETELVTCGRLDDLFDRHGIDAADFVKIDIEGSEPALRDAVSALRDRVRSYYIEFSQFAPIADYMALADTLLSQGFACFDEPASNSLRNIVEIEQHVRHAFAPGPIAVTNLWFVGR